MTSAENGCHINKVDQTNDDVKLDHCTGDFSRQFPTQLWFVKYKKTSFCLSDIKMKLVHSFRIGGDIS